jgi:primosomal protein N' (replication factor Y)
VIVVDEEHESSYKQEEKPRYHARHAALVRAREAGAVVLLGSATPDLESYHNGRAGRYRLISLPERPVGEMPEIEIVDMRGEPAPEGFSRRLTEELERALASGRQAIIFYNRRGFARALQCAACGTAAKCPNCDIGLTFHLRPRRLLCHYCGHAQPAPEVCPACGGAAFIPAGGGTEKIELGLCAAFPRARILRLDQDATRRRGSHDRILGAFAAGDADVLVGTQMVTKGHHFPEVALVGVLAADDGLTLPDFRADERAFQLLTQVAGRTGRIRPGKVIFQTYQPDHPIIEAAARHDYLAFAEQELSLREALGYPPARRLLRIAVSGRRQAAAEAAAGELAAAIRHGLPDQRHDILGPAPAVFARLQDRFRWQILIKGSLASREKKWLFACARATEAHRRGVEVILDVDPLGLY